MTARPDQRCFLFTLKDSSLLLVNLAFTVQSLLFTTFDLGIRVGGPQHLREGAHFASDRQWSNDRK